MKAGSSFKAGTQGIPSVGIPYVIVNGQTVVKNSRFQKVWAGQPIRFPVEPKGRFEEVEVAEWTKTYAINVPPIDDSGVSPQRAGAKVGDAK